MPKPTEQKPTAQKTIFGPAKYAYLSDIISLRNPSAAYGSVRELEREFNKAGTDAKRLRIARATLLVANRAKAITKKRPLSVVERQQFRDMAGIYKRAAEKLFQQYRVKK